MSEIEGIKSTPSPFTKEVTAMDEPASPSLLILHEQIRVRPSKEKIESIHLPEVFSHTRIDESEELTSKYIDEHGTELAAELEKLGISLEALGPTTEKIIAKIKEGLANCRRPKKRLTVEEAVEVLEDSQRLVITPHANHSLHILTWEKFPPDQPEQIERNIMLFSAVALARKRAIEASSYKEKVFVGVEVDPLDKNGKLDIIPQVLSQLDVVVFVLHPDEFEAYGGLEQTISTRRIETGRLPSDPKEWVAVDPQTNPEKAAELIVSTYENVAKNRQVDILGRLLEVKQVPFEVFLKIPVEKWRGIFSLMKKNNQALEINLKRFNFSNCSLSEEQRRTKGISEETYQKTIYWANLLREAKKIGLSFSLGLDHDTGDFPPTEKMRLQLAYLEKLEIDPKEDIIESSAQEFKNFLAERRAG